MDVVKIKFKDIDYVLSRDVSYSIREYCNKAKMEMIKGIIPGEENRLCLSLLHFCDLVNGGRARCTSFNFTPGSWRGPIPNGPPTFRSSRERAVAIRAYIKEHLLYEGKINSSQVLSVFSGLSVTTVRRHIRNTIEAEDIRHVYKVSPDEYRV